MPAADEQEVDRFEVASTEARDAVANVRFADLAPIAARMEAIGEEDLDGDAFLAAAELHILVSSFDAAERALVRARERIGAAETIERRIEGLRVLRILGPRVAALALAIGRINARHTQASPRERGQLESRMSAVELVLEKAGLDIDNLEGGYDAIFGLYWGAHHAAMFRLALALESLIDALFPNVDRLAIMGTVRENLEVSVPLVRAVAGVELAGRLVDAARAASLEHVREAGEEILRIAQDLAFKE